ncbi:MAG: SAM-dependent methyltransferase [Candidatus Acidiferrales bacterium]
MPRYNDKQKIVEHYNFVSPYYRELWGKHLHHGYWIRGDESKELAQVQLIEHLAEAARIRAGQKILDVGCGFGGSSIYLAKNYQADVTGITISPVQVAMATEAAALEGVVAKFLLMDAEAMHFDELFDLVWSVESVAHYQDVAKFFASVANLLKPGGTLALTDWFKKEDLAPRNFKKFIQPIERGMFVEMHTMEDYATSLRASGLKIIQSEILNDRCARTWDFASEIIRPKSLWSLAVQQGPELVRFLRAFRSMRAAFASGNFIYGLFIATKS